MLTELRIANFAIIDHLHLTFSNGFQVFTGETGAGKSILVDAIALLVGERASVDLIRTDADEAEVEAAFTVPAQSAILERLRAGEILGSQEADLIVRRVVSRSGRHRIYVNGRLAPLHVIQDLAGTLVDIHGQHDQQSLLHVEAQLDVLDAFGSLRQLRSEYAGLYQSWQSAQRALSDAVTQSAEGKRQEDYLRFQYQELEQAALRAGEEEALRSEHNRLAHARRLEELGEGAYQALYGSEQSVLSGMKGIEGQLRELGAMDPEVSEWGGLCEGTMVQLRELAYQVRDYVHRLEQDPERLAAVEERLDLIQRLKKKYGAQVDDLLCRAQELKDQLGLVETSQSRIEEMEERVVRAYDQVRSVAAQLSDARQRAARDLEARVKKELAALRMGRTVFQVEVDQGIGESRLTPSGADRVSYLLSANPGEPPLPLAKVASGGELSRVMLALKTVLAQVDQVPVLIFDEIDAGIGGAAAEVMGRRLKRLGATHQVFCITHLPQIASQGDWHFVVEKTGKQRAATRVNQLDHTARQEEIARMLGGVTITQAVRQTAAEMIRNANRDA